MTSLRNTFRLLLCMALTTLFLISAAKTRQEQRPTRGFKEMELTAARNFGKRSSQIIRNTLAKWLSDESKWPHRADNQMAEEEPFRRRVYVKHYLQQMQHPPNSYY